MTSTTPQPFSTANGLAGLKTGTGPNLVLLHGVGLRSAAWLPLMEQIKDRFTLYAIDMAGHGDSEALDISSPDLQDYSKLVADYLESFQEPIYLAGHSMGAMIALDVAIHRPERISRLAALNAVYRRSDAAKMAVQARAADLQHLVQAELNTDATLSRWFGDNPAGDKLNASIDCKTWLHRTPIAQYRKAYHVFAHHDGPSPAQLEQLPMPALFMTGADEPNSTPDMSQNMAQITPFGRAHIVQGAAHMMPMTHAQEVASILKSHFNVANKIGA